MEIDVYAFADYMNLTVEEALEVLDRHAVFDGELYGDEGYVFANELPTNVLEGYFK